MLPTDPLPCHVRRPGRKREPAVVVALTETGCCVLVAASGRIVADPNDVIQPGGRRDIIARAKAS